MNKTDSPLKKLITSNLYTRYSNILSISDISLFLLDTNGDILLEFIPSPDFCTNVCQENDKKVCSDYICQLENDKEGRFVCHNGLENILSPIIVKDETIGYIAGMQIYSKDNEHKKYMIDIHDFEKSENANLEFIAKSISSLKTVESKKLKYRNNYVTKLLEIFLLIYLKTSIIPIRIWRNYQLKRIC